MERFYSLFCENLESARELESRLWVKVKRASTGTIFQMKVPTQMALQQFAQPRALVYKLFISGLTTLISAPQSSLVDGFFHEHPSYWVSATSFKLTAAILLFTSSR